METATPTTNNLNSLEATMNTETTITTHHTHSGVTCGETVRIYGDTFKHSYTVTGIFTRLVRDGHRLVGADSVAQVQIATWSGRVRTVSASRLTTDFTWTERDSAIASNRSKNRAANRAAAAECAAARRERMEFIYQLQTRREEWRAANGESMTLAEIDAFARAARAA